MRDGDADAVVSCGSTGAVLAAAVLGLGRLPGVARPSLAVVVPGLDGRVVYLDAGATVQADAELLLASALQGAAYAATALGVAEPRVALLSTGSEPGKGDDVRRAAAALLAEALADLPPRDVGLVEGHDVPRGAAADVVVTDGFTGNVLLKGLEGTWAALLRAVAEEADGADVPPEVATAARALVRRAFARMDPSSGGGALLLGVPGVVVVGHGSADAAHVATCVAAAARAVREDVPGRTAAWLAPVVARRATVATPRPADPGDAA